MILKKIFKKIIVNIITWEAKLVINKYKHFQIPFRKDSKKLEL
jgi:hypothetical protein